MTLASPSQQDSQHLLEKRHRNGALLTGELPNVKPGSSPSLVGNAQTRIIIIKGHVSPIYLFSLQFLHFVFQQYRKAKPRCKHPHCITEPPSQESLKNANHAYLFPNSETPAAHTGRVLPGERWTPPSPPTPLRVKSRHAYCYTEARYIQPSFTSLLKQHYVLWTKSHSSAPCSKCLLVSDGDKS